MTLTLTREGKTYQIDPAPIELAIGLQFDGPQPNAYGVPPASSQAFEGGGFVGDVRRGGSVNFETHHLTPHCNGTHTECVGHLTEARLSVHQLLRDSWTWARLHSVQPVEAAAATDHYDPPLAEHDQVITAQNLQVLWKNWTPGQALVLRSYPNSPGKRQQNYLTTPPPFFSLEAMQAIRAAGVGHLLVDLPSVDRLFDEGKLRNHRIFWGLEPGQVRLPLGQTPLQTITEMIYVPDEVPDGEYLLELQIAPFEADAAPSRPRLFRVEEVEDNI